VLRADDEPLAPTRLHESDWLRRPVFRVQELPAAASALGAMRWLCIGPRALGAELARAVRAGGGNVALVQHGDGEAIDADGWTLPLHDSHAWARALAQIQEAHGAPQRVLFAWPIEQGEGQALVHALVAMWQAFGRSDLASTVRCLAVTSGAVRVANEPMERVDQAVVPGFLRVVPREYQGARTRSIDVDAASLAQPETLVQALRREIEADDAPLHVALRAGARHVQELIAVEPGTSNGAPTGASTSAPNGSPWRERGVYLVSGGLGGIGLLLAEHLARRAKAKLVLVGRRGLPGRELWDRWLDLRRGDAKSRLILRIREMERSGAEVEVFAGDVADRAAMERIVRAATRRFGALHGVVHAAGVLDDGLIQLRTREQTERMLAPKLTGARVLDEVTADQPLDLFVLFGSTSGLAGIPGQCDYAAANAGLDAFANWRSTARAGRTLSVDWGLWQDVGMLAGNQAAAVPAPAWLGARAEREGDVEFAGPWSPATHWQLAEHKILGGDCVLPGTGHIELMTAAVQTVAGTAAVSLQRLEFLTPLAFPGGAARTVIVAVRRLRDSFEISVQSAEPGNTDVHARTTHSRALARAAEGTGGIVDVAAWRQTIHEPAPVTSDQNRHVAFGPRWQCIDKVWTSGQQVLGQLRLPAALARDLDEHRLHPALLDVAFGCGIRMLSDGASDALFVPVGCEEVLVSGRLPAEVWTHVVLRHRDETSRLHTLDVTVASPEGIVLVELRGLQLFGVRGGFAGGHGTAATQKAPLAPARPVASPVGAPVPRIQAILARGITGPEGMLGLERALACGAPQAVVSSLDVARTAHWLSLPPEKPHVANVPPPAPADGTVADAPRDDVEHRLAASFRELLGVESPGLDQDFFELGGHSLLAVRLFARLHGDFGLDLELATLLGAGTVRKLAAVVREALHLPEPGSEPVRSVAAKKGQHVVPIQMDGRRPKLFLVHGAGGNVLGFRELSHYFGKDQPVYGLQARGVDGKQPPHDTILEMANAYLGELREVQPHGPYYLGGYSGGGVVAYEMAQLLRAIGEPVAFVGMIDSWCPQLPRRGPVSRLLLHIARVLRRGPKYSIDILKMKWQRIVSAKRNEQAREQGSVMPQAMRGLEVQFGFERAFERHQVKPYAGKVWMFRCATPDVGTRYVFDQRLGWGPFITDMAITTCPGDHFTMCTEPNVQVLCREMMAAMDEAIAAADGKS